MNEDSLYEMYLEWIVDNHSDCWYIIKHGADDGSLMAYEDSYLWDEFEESIGL